MALDMTLKECSGECGAVKPLSEFYRDSASPDGHTHICKVCSRARSAEWRKNNPEKAKALRDQGNARAAARQTPPAMDGEKACTGCGESKPVTEFYANRRTIDGRTSRCKACAQAATLKWREANPDKVRAAAKEWEAVNRPKRNTQRKERQAANPEPRKAERQRYWQKHRPRLLAEAKEWRESPEGVAYLEGYKERKLDLLLRRRYGITLAQWNELLERQGGACAICGLPPSSSRNFDVDHDHACCAGPTSCGKCVRGLLCAGCNQGLGNFHDDTRLLQNAVNYLRTTSVLEVPGLSVLCGTRSGFLRHARFGELPCDQCVEAERLAALARSARRTRGNGRPRPPCGTVNAYNAHNYHGEPACDECAAAMREYNRERRQRAKQEPAST